MSKYYEEFKTKYSENKIAIVPTDFIYMPFFDMAYNEFKHIVKKKFLEDKQVFVVRACLESEVALDNCWKCTLIGLRPIDEPSPFTKKHYKNWRDLIKHKT